MNRESGVSVTEFLVVTVATVSAMYMLIEAQPMIVDVLRGHIRDIHFTLNFPV